MATRYISSNAAAHDFEALLVQVNETGDEVVLQIDGEPVARIVPLSVAVRNVIAREKFGPFWDEHKRWLAENPTDVTEVEEMELIDREIAAYRAEKEAEHEAVSEALSVSTAL